MVHAAMAALQPGEVLVLTMPEPAPVALLRRPARDAGAGPRRGGACSSTRAVRDVEELAELGLPIWARWVRVSGATRTSRGALDVPVTVGGARSAPATSSCSTPTASRSSRPSASTRCSRRRSSARRRSASSASSSQAGALSYDLDGLRAKVEGAAR